MNETSNEKIEYAVSKKGAAERLSVSVKTIERLIARGDLDAFRVMGQVRIMISELQSFIRRQLEKQRSKLKKS